MKKYLELKLSGLSKDLKEFILGVKNINFQEWKLIEKELSDQYLIYQYIGQEVNKAQVFIHLENDLDAGEIKVVNIIPIEKGDININEYNDILKKFYKDIICSINADEYNVKISMDTSNEFDPLEIISKDALNKLHDFCRLTNKTTGATHPNDKERWYNFICQTVEDNRTFDCATLANFLQDESYWGKKKNLGPIGEFAWEEDKAWELARQYEIGCSIVEYYINNYKVR